MSLSQQGTRPTLAPPEDPNIAIDRLNKNANSLSKKVSEERELIMAKEQWIVNAEHKIETDIATAKELIYKGKKCCKISCVICETEHHPSQRTPKWKAMVI